MTIGGLSLFRTVSIQIPVKTADRFLAPMLGLERGGRRPQKWIKHYSSDHQILLVGEGDFSFSLSLAMAFESAVNIVATSLDSYNELLTKYRYASDNLTKLAYLGASLMHGVDATKMSFLYPLQGRKFHRIIFNFPHAGFLGKEDNLDLIEKHRNLVRGFFMNASKMLWPNGEIHVNHKVTPPFTDWKIKELAAECLLLFVGLDVFRIRDYPFYENKRGSGLRPDDPFPLGQSGTYRFELSTSSEGILELRRNPSSSTTMYQDIPYPVSVQPKPSHLATTMYPGIPHSISPPLQSVPYISQPYLSSYAHDYSYLPNEQTTECRRIFGWYLQHVEETFGSDSDDVRQSLSDALSTGFATYMSAAPRGSLSGYISILEELRRSSESRTQWLRELVSRYG